MRYVHLIKAKPLYKRQTNPHVRGCYLTTMPADVELRKNRWCEPQGMWRQDEMIASSKVTLTLTYSELIELNTSELRNRPRQLVKYVD
jgi:hypothetical protein